MSWKAYLVVNEEYERKVFMCFVWIDVRRKCNVGFLYFFCCHGYSGKFIWDGSIGRLAFPVRGGCI